VILLDIIKIEKRRQDLLKQLDLTNSPRRKLLLLNVFISELLSVDDQNIINSYLLEFSEVYVKLLSKWEPFYLPPEVSENILKIAGLVIDHPSFLPLRDKLEDSILLIKKRLVLLVNILKNEIAFETEDNYKVFFPLIEEDYSSSNTELYPFIESLTVKISRGIQKNKFIIIPSPKVIDEKLEKQVEISWNKAIEILKESHKRINPYHDVVVNFDKKLGEYVGHSLGIALTLAFLNELFSFYITPIKFYIKSGTAFSGGVSEKGEIIPIGNEELIAGKIKCVFYSGIKQIVLHRDDEPIAKKELDSYLEAFPERNLKVISIEDLEDLLNRRNIVDIKKQNPVVRTGKFIKKQKIAVIIFLISLIGFLYVFIDFDNNPAYLTNFKNIVYVHNNNGRVLWKKRIFENIDKPYVDKNHMEIYEKIININNDGNNEVLLSEYVNSKTGNIYNRIVACFNYNGELIWKYKFDDAVITAKDVHNKNYNSRIIDTLSENSIMQVILIAENDPLYPSAIYKLDARTGKRLPGTFWHAGHIVGAALGDFNENGKKEIVAVAISNCFEHCVLFSINVDSLKGQGLADKAYFFIGIQQAKLNKYILIPKSDLTDYYKMRFNNFGGYEISYDERDKYFNFTTIEGDPLKNAASISYKANNKLTDIRIFISDKFQVIRDSLVANGKLHLPYSNTQEYTNILKKQIKYWDGERFKNLF